MSRIEQEGQGRRALDAHRRELERITRLFLDYAVHHPLYRFAAGTARFLEDSRALIEQMDVLEPRRKKRPPRKKL